MKEDESGDDVLRLLTARSGVSQKPKFSGPELLTGVLQGLAVAGSFDHRAIITTV